MENRQFIFSLLVGILLLIVGIAMSSAATVGLSLASLGLAIVLLALWNNRSHSAVNDAEPKPVFIKNSSQQHTAE